MNHAWASKQTQKGEFLKWLSFGAVACGEFCGQLLREDRDVDESLEEIDVLDKAEERIKSCQETLEQGPTIIYVPTRKETLSVSKFLCQSGVKAAAYNASVCSLIYGAKFMLISGSSQINL